MEILSPVGSKDALTAAIRSGADAVYFGASSFNARRNAKNFSDDEFKEVVSYCHIRNVKTYLTINTLVSNEEFDSAIELVKKACEASIDAIIIADLGLADFIKKAAPNMPLHASTQMTIHNADGVRLLKEKGYSRVVLARENTLEEIKEIAKVANEINMELEIFVQGAHCMCVSGQCLLSSVLGSRSGNRGLCAQPCRLPFQVSNGNGYDLSLKDMNLYNYFDEFEKLGICSLKIEGRMKTPEYVAMATSAAKTAIQNKNELPEKLEILKTVFSRSGFSDGFLRNKIDKDMFGTRSEEDIINSKQIKNSIHELYRHEYQSVPIKLELTVDNSESVLTLSDGKNTVTVKNNGAEPAQNKPSTKEELETKLNKLGSTPYYAGEIKINIENNLFFKNSILTELKNEAITELTEIRGKVTPIPFFYEKEKLEKDTFVNPIIEKYISVHTLDQIPDNTSIADMIFVPFNTQVNDVSRLIDNGYNIAIKTPVTLFSKNIDEKLIEFQKVGVEFALVQNIGALKTVKNAGLEAIAGHRLNLFNSNSVDWYDFSSATISVELSETQLHNFNCNIPIGIYAYGKLPLMTFRNCPIQSNNGCNKCDHTIKDRKDLSFKIMCEDGCTQLYNNRPIYIGNKPNLYKNMDFILFSFVDENKDTVEKIIKMYDNNSEFKEEFTRGLYFKGVL